MQCDPCCWLDFIQSLMEDSSIEPSQCHALVGFLQHCVPCLLSNNGKVKAKVAPLPLVLLKAQILPPWASTMFFEINKPSPVPDEELVTNFKIIASTVGSIPGPVSLR